MTSRFHYIAALLLVLVTCYLTHHTIHGSRGLIALFALESQIAGKQEVLAVINAERQNLEKEALLLQSSHIDNDLIEELARKYWSMSTPDETVVIIR